MMDAATDFGLTREEAWSTFSDALAGGYSDANQYVDDVAGALAQQILSKQRRIQGQPPS
jgi:hypothetical protein